MPEGRSSTKFTSVHSPRIRVASPPPSPTTNRFSVLVDEYDSITDAEGLRAMPCYRMYRCSIRKSLATNHCLRENEYLRARRVDRMRKQYYAIMEGMRDDLTEMIERFDDEQGGAE